MGEYLGNVPAFSPPPGSRAPVLKAPAEVYRQEAARLCSMAASPMFSHVRDGLNELARLYDRLSAQVEEITAHRFGKPFALRSRGG